jgi:hypothetical protein
LKVYFVGRYVSLYAWRAGGGYPNTLERWQIGMLASLRAGMLVKLQAAMPADSYFRGLARLQIYKRDDRYAGKLAA